MLATRLIIQARDCIANGNFQEAFDQFNRAFIIAPQLKSANQSQFYYVVLHLCNYHEENDDHEGLLETYKQTLNHFSDCSYVHHSMGRYLFKNGLYMEAWNQFQEILDIESSSVNAEHHINVLKSFLIQRWHFRMLNDESRNHAYRAALHESVVPHTDSVLDLGAGTGLLAAYAAECNPVATVGIEVSKMLCDIAGYFMNDNNIKSVKIINKLSLNVDAIEIGGKKSLLVTELFDAGLFGEGIIGALDHAYKNLLLVNGRVVPKGAEFFVRGIKSESLITRYILNECARTLLNIPIHKHILASHNSYDCADIHSYGDLKYMTDAVSLLKIDFNNPADLEMKLNNTVEYNVDFKPVESGEVSTIIGCFTLHLTDNISLTTDPTSENCASAWQQAIFCNFLPKQVIENNPFSVNFQLSNGSKMALVPDSDCCMKISESVMRFLNDKKFVEVANSCVSKVFAYLQHLANGNIMIADICPFPIFGLMILKRGGNLLYCRATTTEDQEFFMEVFEANGINKERYKFIDSEQQTLKEIKFHALYYHIFDENGSIDPIQIRNTHYMQMVNLIDRGMIMPYQIKVMCQLVNSPMLDRCNRVDDKNTGYKLSHHLNKFQVSVNCGIDFTVFKYTTLANPIGIGSCGSMKSDIFSCPVVRNGAVNAILCWYEIEVLMSDSERITTNRPNCCIDGMAFLVNPEMLLATGENVDIICCVDDDESFKLIIDVEDAVGEG